MKQVIVVRKDLNMRKGKMVAQGAHASIGAMDKATKKEVLKWLETGATKICVGVDDKTELLIILNEAQVLELPTYLVIDAGKTEFKERTLTAIAIGPAEDDVIDKVTGKLKLL